MAKLGDFEFRIGGKSVYPLMIGGMGVDISTSALALEAARVGAIGHISDAMAPYVSDRRLGTHYQSDKLKKYREFVDSKDKSQVKWAPEIVYEATRNHVQSTMQVKCGEGMVFANVMEKLTMGNPAETLRARLQGALDGGIDGVTLSAGLHKGTLGLIADHPRFRDVLFGIIVSSPRALSVFLKASKRVDRYPDYIIVEGPLAGGHLGFGPDWKEHNLETIVTEVIELLKNEGLEIPVIPAGGVFTGGDAVRFIEKGAAAVQVATRFTISQECGLPAHVKQIYLKADEEDVEVNMSSPTGYPMRMLKQSPSLLCNIRPNCESLGYILDREGKCAYHEAYEKTPVDEKGRKLPVREKMCICYNFMNYSCYTCGHNVYRLKDTTTKVDANTYYLPRAEQIINDYLNTADGQVVVATPAPAKNNGLVILSSSSIAAAV